MQIRHAAFPVLLALVAGCSGFSRDERVEQKLEQAGIKPKLARCLAPKLARNLSDDQLRALAAATRQPSPDGGHGRKALAEKLSGMNDPKIADVVSRAALSCAIMG